MLFNSIEFVIFFFVVWVLYWNIGTLPQKIKLQNWGLLIASYLFYACWDWRFLSLIVLSSAIDFTVGASLDKTNNTTKRKALLALSLLVNLGMLGFFKYFNFFTENWITLWQQFGIAMHPTTWNIILPVGISFYTFQTMSYTIDIYRKRIKAVNDPVAFFTFVAFFPQLVAGPIERASSLLPQFIQERKFSYEQSKDGLRLILWGLFKKIVIADTCATNVDLIFANYDALSGPILMLGAVLFAFQIYGDFSGYSDVAIGVSKLLGFNLMDNFRLPYFSRDVGEFWRRWHISLSSWFRDYLYIPLGGSRFGKFQQIRNVLLTFTISGFWHGANWTFIVWGFLNGLFFLPLVFNENRKNQHKNKQVASSKHLPNLKETFQIFSTFALISLTWIFFRSPNISTALGYLKRIVLETWKAPIAHEIQTYLNGLLLVQSVLLLVFLLVLEWAQRNKKHPLCISNWAFVGRWGLYYGLVFAILYFFQEERHFIYFQF